VKFTVLIPSRYDSSRLPGKPLEDLNGKSLIQRVYEAASLSKAERVVVATDSVLIQEECTRFNGESVLTKSSHLTGSDRLSEAASILSMKEDQIVVNLQGDEPFMSFNDINEVASLLENSQASMSTLYANLPEESFDNPNVVKIWVNKDGGVLDFSRDKNKLKEGHAHRFQHIGIYSYQVGFLNNFIRWQQTDNEILESLEQLRVLDRGYKIAASKSFSSIHLGIDTPEDLANARVILSK